MSGVQQQNEALKQKEKFYEGFDTGYIYSISDDWLIMLEQKFQNINEKLREEKARRKYKNKIQGLKD